MTHITSKRLVGLVAAGALGLGVALAALGSSDSPESPGHRSTPASRGGVALIHATYPTYRTVGDLRADADVVVSGTVTRIVGTRRVIPPSVPLDQLPQHKREQAGFVVSDVVVRVDGVLAGSPAVNGKEIVVTELGGSDASGRFVAEDEPNSRPGQQVVEFLRQGEDNRFRVVGGSQGRFLQRDGRLRGISEGADAPVNKRLEGMTVSTFKDNFGRIAASSPQDVGARKGSDRAGDGSDRAAGKPAAPDSESGPPTPAG